MEDKSKNTLQAIQFSGIRGSETIRAVTLPVGDRALRIAVVHGLVNAQKLLDDIESGQEYFDLVEVMTCKTGCVGGAGQPYGLIPVKQQRAEGLYEADRTALIKRSERNPIVTKLLGGSAEGPHPSAAPCGVQASGQGVKTSSKGKPLPGGRGFRPVRRLPPRKPKNFPCVSSGIWVS